MRVPSKGTHGIASHVIKSMPDHSCSNPPLCPATAHLVCNGIDHSSNSAVRHTRAADLDGLIKRVLGDLAELLGLGCHFSCRVWTSVGGMWQCVRN